MKWMILKLKNWLAIKDLKDILAKTSQNTFTYFRKLSKIKISIFLASFFLRDPEVLY